jgi:hypothetical protein
VADISECTVVVRYRSDSPDGWPWAVSHEGSRRVLTITDLDDSSLGLLLRALAQAGGSADEDSEHTHELARC